MSVKTEILDVDEQSTCLLLANQKKFMYLYIFISKPML